MRVKLSKSSLKQLFGSFWNRGNRSPERVAARCGITIRSLRDWKTGKFTIPQEAFETLVAEVKLDPKVLAPKILPDFWSASDAGKKGGATRVYRGNFGTLEGRRKGGFASLTSHKNNKTPFWTLKSIRKPEYSENLAELLGILFGDGHLSKYQVSITTSARTDRGHANFVRDLIGNLFGIQAVLSARPKEGVMTVVASSVAMVQFLNKLGMPIGNKINNKISIPKWVKSSSLYQKAFIRGLFDTDGCVYLDIHKHKERTYSHLGWTITSYAATLVADVIGALKNLGFSPTHRDSQRSVYLRRGVEVEKYFRRIGTHNPKHRRRYLVFQGRVPKWS